MILPWKVIRSLALRLLLPSLPLLLPDLFSLRNSFPLFGSSDSRRTVLFTRELDEIRGRPRVVPESMLTEIPRRAEFFSPVVPDDVADPLPIGGPYLPSYSYPRNNAE